MQGNHCQAVPLTLQHLDCDFATANKLFEDHTFLFKTWPFYISLNNMLAFVCSLWMRQGIQVTICKQVKALAKTQPTSANGTCLEFNGEIALSS